MPDSFISRWLRASYAPLPLFSPKWFNRYNSEQDFLKDHFFDHLEFDSLLLYSSFYPVKLEFYLRNILLPDPGEQKAGIDLILQKSNDDESVHAYLVQFLLHFYSTGNNQRLIEYIGQHPLVREGAR